MSGVSTTVEVTPPESGFERADIVFAGVEQAGPSFEGRVFLDNPGADETTPRSAEHGYAGSFSVYGYGEPLEPAVADRASAGTGAVAPITKRVVATEAVRAALARSNELTITVVAVPPVDPLHLGRVSVVFDGTGDVARASPASAR
jgi:tyrosinase